MDVRAVSDWLEGLSPEQRLETLVRIYLRLTVATRQFFLPDSSVRDKRFVEVFHGVNELHHTLANQLGAALDREEYFPVGTFSQQLQEIATRYRIDSVLNWAIESVQK